MSDNKEMIPIHVALIPDGNRRWAKKKMLLPCIGHLWGARALEKILAESLKMGVKCVTFWGGSYDNLTKRPEKEVSYLISLYGKYLQKLLKRKELQKDKIRVKVLGRVKELLPAGTFKIIKDIEKLTEKNDKLFLNILIGYNGTDEILYAVRSIAEKSQAFKIKPEEITEEVIKQNLWTHDTPPVDLIIRTGEEGDPHNSTGFMMFDTAYSQYYFTKTMWPDFSPEEFKKSIEKFLKTERRGGK